MIKKRNKIRVIEVSDDSGQQGWKSRLAGENTYTILFFHFCLDIDGIRFSNLLVPGIDAVEILKARY